MAPADAEELEPTAASPLTEAFPKPRLVKRAVHGTWLSSRLRNLRNGTITQPMKPAGTAKTKKKKNLLAVKSVPEKGYDGLTKDGKTFRPEESGKTVRASDLAARHDNSRAQYDTIKELIQVAVQEALIVWVV